MVWGDIGISHKAGPVIFQNIGSGMGDGVTAMWYCNHAIRVHIVPYFDRHQNRMFQQDNAHSITARATRDFCQQYNIRIMP